MKNCDKMYTLATACDTDSPCQILCLILSFVCLELPLSAISIELEQTPHHKCQKNGIHLCMGVKLGGFHTVYLS